MRNKFIKKNKIILLGCVLTIALILFLSNYLKSAKIEKEKPKISAISVPNYTFSVSLLVPAVDSYGNGVTTTLKVYILPGTGKTLVDINQLLFWIDTQQSIQIAKRVAEEVTGVDLSKFDIIYSIQELNATLIGGPSAGAALTIATIAAIKGKELGKEVTITGTIDEKGNIGKVGGIIPKAHASKEAGVKTLLVPKGQGTQVNYIPKEECERVGYFTFCKITYTKEIVNVGKAIGIEVIEVEDIKDAMKYFGL